MLDGQPAYDTTFFGAGGFGLFYYPPTFIPLVLPFGLLGATTATWLWIGLSIAAFAIGVVVLPVAGRTKWLLVLLAGLSWPFLYALKLGQVGPILFALFAAGWAGMSTPSRARHQRRPRGGDQDPARADPAVGAAHARTVVAAFVIRVLGVLALLAVVATILAGTEAWSDFFTLMGRVSDPITTPHNFTPGAVAYQAGVSRETAVRADEVTPGVGCLVRRRAWWRPSPSSRRPCGCRPCRSYLIAESSPMPAAVADPVGPLRADPAAAGRVADRARLDVASSLIARLADLHPADRVRAARDLSRFAFGHCDAVSRCSPRGSRTGAAGAAPLA